MVQPIFHKVAVSLLFLAMSVLCITGCSEERKREAARLAAELEGKERGETLAPETTSSEQQADTLIVASDTIALPRADSTATLDSVVAAIQSSLQRQSESSDSLAVQPARGMPPMIHDGYTVQVESSPSQSYIMQQVQAFTQRGYDAYLGTVTVEGKTYFRLRIGRFADRTEAVRVSEEINSMFNLRSWVDKASW